MKISFCPWTLAILFPFLSVCSPAALRQCSYKPPSRFEVLPPVSLENGHSVKKRDVSSQWGQLRVKIYYDDISLKGLSNTQQRLIKERIVPEAVKFWSDALKVIQSTAPIRLHRKCQSNAAGEYKVHYPDPSDLSVFYCDQGCDVKTFCGDVEVPDEHLLQCLYLAPSSRSFLSAILPLAVSTKQSTGPPDGPGVSDADFVLYVSALETDRCNVSKTVAYAAHCQQETSLDRPIAGHANLCPHAISDNPSDIETILSTVKHEILHALGFSVALFAFYRDTVTGAPRTPRDQYGRPSWNPETNTYQWSDSVVKRIERTDWQVRQGGITRPMHMLVTPRVVEEARKHFACGDLEGGELENQGGEGTVLTHWEKRVYENEAMTGVHTQNPIYSRLTFAALEDSGWYRPDYSMAGEVTFGQNLGCGFAMKSCKSWMDQAAVNKTSPQPYCNKLKTTANSMIKTECNPGRSALSICNLTPFSTDLPPEYQNFASMPGVPSSEIGHYGGSVDLADYCPFMQNFLKFAKGPPPGRGHCGAGVFELDDSEPGLCYLYLCLQEEFSWKATTGTVRGARCTVEDNQPDSSLNFALEKYGKQSMCFAQDKAWTERTCFLTRTWQHWGSGCYEHECKNGRLHILVENKTLICYTEGQRLQLQIMGQEWLHSGTIVCPSCAAVCQGHGDFKCLPDMPLSKDQKDRETWDYLDCNSANSVIPFPVIPSVIASLISIMTYIHLVTGTP